MGRIHHHHEVELNYLFRGEVTYLHRGAFRRLAPGRLTVFWGSTPHSLVTASPKSEMAWITVPLTWVWGWGLPEPFMRGLMEGAWWTSPVAQRERYPIRSWVKEMCQAGEPGRKRLLLELQACFLLLAEQASKSPALPSPNEGRLRHVERMARYMAEHFRDDIEVADVAAAAELHPNYAMALFRRLCGVTIRDYLLQHRLTRAQQLLLTTEDKVIDVALASGFGSQSVFYEIFRDTVNMTPLEFRRHTRT